MFNNSSVYQYFRHCATKLLLLLLNYHDDVFCFVIICRIHNTAICVENVKIDQKMHLRGLVITATPCFRGVWPSAEIILCPIYQRVNIVGVRESEIEGKKCRPRKFSTLSVHTKCSYEQNKQAKTGGVASVALQFRCRT